MDHSSVRANNLALVFREVLEQGPRSRARLAQDTGLNKTTVSSLVGELIDAGILVDREVERSQRVGRPGQLVDVNGEQIMGLGLELSADYVAVCLKDLFGRVVAERYETSRNRGVAPELLARRLAALADEVLEQWLRDDTVLAGSTVAVPGLVDRDGVTLLAAPALELDGVALGTLLERELTPRPGGLPDQRVRIARDAHLGALAEQREGAGRDLEDFAYVFGGAGVSAGLVVGGELVRGAEGFAGELGHVPIDADGPACACGARGCLEASMRESLVELVGGNELESSPSDTTNAIRDAVAARVRARDPQALAALDELGRRLGMGLAVVGNLLNPQAIVLGGYLSALSDWLLDTAETELRSRLAARGATELQLHVGVLGGYAPLRGAALDAISHVVRDPRLPAQLAAGGAAGRGNAASQARTRDVLTRTG